MGMLQMKRVYEAPEEQDGYRILVDRLWPRGISREKAKLDLWAKSIAPTNELRAWYGHVPERFGEFARRYREELKGNPDMESFRMLAARKLQDGNVTPLYAAKEGALSNAAVLLEDLKA